MDTLRVPGGEGRAVPLGEGQCFRVIDVAGGQVGDLFAFAAADPGEFASASHTRVAIRKLFPQPGDPVLTNRRRPVLSVVEDTSPGRHDMLYAACDPARYALLGAAASHRSHQLGRHHPARTASVREVSMSAAAASPIPVIDLAPFHKGGVAGKRAVAAHVDAACRDFGFLQVTGHGVPGPVCDDLLSAWAAFFDLPMGEKLRWVVPDESANRGYSWPGKEALAHSRGEQTPPDLMEAFNVGRRVQDDPYFERHAAFYAPTAWPGRPQG